jgi:hypothetical protein
VTNTTTGEVKKGNAGGFKKGGSAKKMAMGGLSAARGKPRFSMEPEKEGNFSFGEMYTPETPEPPKYKKGGTAKKAFAAGGSVNDSGRPVAYPAKPVSKSVKNNLQSGTFKHGRPRRLRTRRCVTPSLGHQSGCSRRPKVSSRARRLLLEV